MCLFADAVTATLFARACDAGYVSRAAFKLLEVQKKHKVIKQGGSVGSVAADNKLLQQPVPALATVPDGQQALSTVPHTVSTSQALRATAHCTVVTQPTQ